MINQSLVAVIPTFIQVREVAQRVHRRDHVELAGPVLEVAHVPVRELRAGDHLPRLVVGAPQRVDMFVDIFVDMFVDKTNVFEKHCTFKMVENTDRAFNTLGGGSST